MWGLPSLVCFRLVKRMDLHWACPICPYTFQHCGGRQAAQAAGAGVWRC